MKKSKESLTQLVLPRALLWLWELAAGPVLFLAGHAATLAQRAWRVCHNVARLVGTIILEAMARVRWLTESIRYCASAAAAWAVYWLVSPLAIKALHAAGSTLEKAHDALKAIWRFTWPTRRFLRVPLMFALIGAVMYASSGVLIVPPNAYTVLSMSPSPSHTVQLPYTMSPGVWWVDPSLARDEVYTIRDLPTTDYFLDLALRYDAHLDALVGAGQLHNPLTEAELAAMADVIVGYLRETPGLNADFEFNGIIVFTPNAATPSKYDVDVAHWSRIATDDRGRPICTGEPIHNSETGQWGCRLGEFIPDNRVYVNREQWGSMRRTDQSILGLMTHELVHGALSITITADGRAIFDQETLNQIITADILHEMEQDGVPGAAAAFAEHMRDLALYSAKYRAYFAQDLAANVVYQSNLMLGDQIHNSTEANLPTVWQPPSQRIAVVDWGEMALEFLRGNVYAAPTRVDASPFPVMDWAKQQILLIRQNGIHIRPYTILRDTIGYHSWWAAPARAIFGPDWVHWQFGFDGEIDRFNRVQTAILGRSASAEYTEKWETHNQYFADVWFRYSYAPLMTILGNVNYDLPIMWRGLVTSDLNDLAQVVSVASLNQYLPIRRFSLSPAEWVPLLSPTGDNQIVQYDLPAKGRAVRPETGGRAIAMVVRERSYETWRIFPSAWLALIALYLSAKALKTRRGARFCRWMVAWLLGPISIAVTWAFSWALYAPVLALDTAFKRAVRWQNKARKQRK